MALDVRDATAGILLKPAAIEFFSSESKLDNENTGEVEWRRLTSLLLPQALKSFLVAAHDYPRI
jgi:hypothetical protein